MDPIGLNECVYDGIVREVGETFQPINCTTCTCTMDKRGGHSGYGKANCNVVSCGTIPCGKEKWVQLPGRCCPECPAENVEKPVEILKCPRDVVQMRLAPDKAYVTFDPELEVRDNLKLRRNIVVRKDPNVTRFWWQGTGSQNSYHTVRVTAKTRAPDGKMDTDICQYTVNVIGK